MGLDLDVIIGVIAIGSILVNVVLAIRKPNEIQNNSITELKKDIVSVKKDIQIVTDDVSLMKANHLPHIERDINEIKIEHAKSFERIFTTLEKVILPKIDKL